MAAGLPVFPRHPSRPRPWQRRRIVGLSALVRRSACVCACVRVYTIHGGPAWGKRDLSRPAWGRANWAPGPGAGTVHSPRPHTHLTGWGRSRSLHVSSPPHSSTCLPLSSRIRPSLSHPSAPPLSCIRPPRPALARSSAQQRRTFLSLSLRVAPLAPAHRTVQSADCIANTTCGCDA